MIISFLINIFTQFVTLLLSALPNGNGLPTDIANSITAFWGYLNAYAYILPVSSIFICLGLAMSFHGSVFTFKAINWFINKLRGSGG